MKPSVLTLSIALCAGTNHAAQDVGLTEFTIPAPHHDREMEVAVLYPATGGREIMFADNAVFHGTPVLVDPEPAHGPHPMILLSHGWGGNYERMTWLSTGLVQRGAVVVAVNHPNSTTSDLNFDSALNHWTRAKDLSMALDHVLKDEMFAPFIDTARIYATGFSYGAWTALSLAGATTSRDGFFQYCTAAGTGSQFCGELADKSVDLASIDQGRFEASYKDDRVRGVAAIDPGLTWGLGPKNVQDLTPRVLLVGLGSGADRLQATDTSARGSDFEALVPESSIEVIAPAMHFTALGMCKPAGEAILIEENDDPVCTDPAGTDRARVLETILDHLSDHFDLD